MQKISYRYLPARLRWTTSIQSASLLALPLIRCSLVPVPTAVWRILQRAAAVLKGKKVAPFAKLIVTPASRKIYEQALADGTLLTLAEAGAMITHPSCGLCCGRTGGILTDGERVVATNNRNFLGRMGTSKVEIFLASPVTAAACAVAGKIVVPEVQ